MKRALLLGASSLLAGSIKKIREGSFYTIALDRNPQAPGAAEAHEFHAIDISNVAAVVDFALKSSVDCVVPFNEFGMRAHAQCCQALGLPGISPDQVESVIDKLAMRRAWSRAGLAQPAYHPAATLEQAQMAAQRLGFPCVIKPSLSGGASRGVSFVADAQQLPAAFQRAMQFALSGQTVLETHLDGLELSVEGLCYQGEYRMLAVADKDIFPHPFARVTSHIKYQAPLEEPVALRVEDLAREAVQALGLANCASHIEMMLNPDGQPYLIEMGARGGGGHISHTIVQAVSGVNMPLALAQILSGQPPRWDPVYNRGACYRFFPAPQGTIAGIEGLAEALNSEGVLDLVLIKGVGDKVVDMLNGHERAGCLVTCGKDRDEALQRAEESLAKIHFTVKP